MIKDIGEIYDEIEELKDTFPDKIKKHLNKCIYEYEYGDIVKIKNILENLLSIDLKEEDRKVLETWFVNIKEFINDGYIDTGLGTYEKLDEYIEKKQIGIEDNMIYYIDNSILGEALFLPKDFIISKRALERTVMEVFDSEGNRQSKRIIEEILEEKENFVIGEI